MKTLYITDYLFEASIKHPQKAMIVWDNKQITYSTVAKQVTSGANWLQTKIETSPKQQLIIGILLSNSPEFIVTYLSIILAGHIAMPLDPNFKQVEAQNVIDQMKPVAVVTDAEHLSYFSKTKTLFVDELTNDSEVTTEIKRPFSPPDKQVVSMLFTSGTTGNPKATPYTHANHLWNIQAVSELWNWTHDDTLLISLPLSHWHGLCVGLTGTLVHGNTMYLQERFDPEETLKALQTGEISMFMHVPIAYSKLIEHNPETKYDISKVRLCISGSSFLPPAMWHKFKERFGQNILERYGASEMGFLTSNSLDSRIAGSVGKPLEGVTIKIQPSGELAMKSPGLFPGYWKNPEATAEHRTKDGLWLSGDIGTFDDQGNIHLKGRVQEKMKKFGYTVYPRDVEWAIMLDPRVKEAAVMSLQRDDQLSDEFIFFVVGDVSQEDIIEFSKKEMPNFWRPDRIFILDSIPRMGRANKPDLKKLRAIAEA